MSRVMKDSDIEWVSSMPKYWDVLKGKFVLEILSREINETDEVITCFRDGEVTLRKNRREDGFTFADKEIGYQGVEPNDLVIHGMDGFAGAIGISDSRGKASPVLNVCDTKQNKRYIMYFLRSMAFNDVFLALSTGIRVRSCDLRWNKLANLLYTIPPLDEQKKIAEFLDKNCKEIDSVIENTRASIDEYKKYKQSVINEAVTKGLNSSVEMKDSGIEWNKHIPSHWEVVNGRRLFTLRKDKAFPEDKQLTASQKYGIIYQEEFMQLENQRVVTVQKDFDILKHVEPNDFVISMRSFQGGLEYSQVRGCISSAYVMLIPNEKVYCPYFKWLFKSVKYINALQSTSNLVRDGQAMRFSNFVQIPLFLIPIEEQKQIAEYLDAKCLQIDALILKKQQIVTELETYKKSLIYECVTGKMEV